MFLTSSKNDILNNIYGTFLMNEKTREYLF